MLTDQQALEAIEHICNDDFCEDMEMRRVAGDFDGNPDLECATKKLIAIYSIAHAFVRSHSCYHVHEDWRVEAELREVTQPAAISRTGRDGEEL